MCQLVGVDAVVAEFQSGYSVFGPCGAVGLVGAVAVVGATATTRTTSSIPVTCGAH